jgi:hypothetical protein
MRQLSEQQAYAATFAFLEYYFELTKDEYLSTLLSGMALHPDGSSMDPAMTGEWRAAVDKALAGTVNVHAELRFNEAAWGRKPASVLRRLFSFVPRWK